jgi:hypothetical protein
LGAGGAFTVIFDLLSSLQPKLGTPQSGQTCFVTASTARQTLMDNPGLTLMGRLPMLLPSQNLFRYLH